MPPTTVRLLLRLPLYPSECHTLYKTDIPVTLFNNTFKENRFNIGELLNTTQTATIPFGGPYLSRSGVMIESMIYLYRMKSEVLIEKNYIAHTKISITIEL